jgi:ribonuclease P protein component
MLDPHTPSRLSVIVPVKVNKKAVVRNTLKRLVYDTMWQILRDKNQDCIVIFKPITLIKGVASNSLISAELKTIHV